MSKGNSGHFTGTSGQKSYEAEENKKTQKEKIEKVKNLEFSTSSKENNEQAKNNETSPQMPYYKDVVVSPEKFFNYSLDYTNPNNRGKAEAYEKGLGFTKANGQLLIDAIQNAVSSGKYSPVRVKESPYGMRYEYEIPIKGPNGQTKKVLAVFQLSPGSTKPVLITNYLLGKEKQ